MATARRAGLLIPSSNTTIEQEYCRFGPSGVSWHFARLDMTRIDEAGIRDQDRDIEEQARRLGAVRPDVLLFCQSAASFVMGRDYDTDLRRRIGGASNAAVLIAAETILEALRALDTRRIVLATPFTGNVNERTQSYFEAAGFEVLGVSGLGIVSNFDVAALNRTRLIELAKSVDRDGAEAIVMPGGNMPCLAHLGAMQEAVGKPVVTTNLSGMRAIARLLGVAPANVLA